MRFTVLTLFPKIIEAYLDEGVIGRAVSKGLVVVEATNIRDFATDKYRTVDDQPFGGGAGMVMKPEPIAAAFDAAGPADRRVLLAPSGRKFTQADAEAWAQLETVQLLCGRYEGIDQRVVDHYVDDVVSVGDYVLSGGELAALVVLDATLRLVPGVLGNSASARHESFSEGLLEHPHYTRPADWRGTAVPEVLLSGHHAKIDVWRRRESLRRTALTRPDLLRTAPLTAAEEGFLSSLELGWEDEES